MGPRGSSRLACTASVRQGQAPRDGGEAMASTHVATPSLQAFLDAFNAHDVDASCPSSPTTVSSICRGPAPGGRRLTGKQQVGAGIRSRFHGIPDVQYGHDRHWTCATAGYPSGRSAAPRGQESPSRFVDATSSSSPTAGSAARTPSGRSSTETIAAFHATRQWRRCSMTLGSGLGPERRRSTIPDGCGAASAH